MSFYSTKIQFIFISTLSIASYISKAEAATFNNSDYQFDDTLLMGSNLGKGSISRFNQDDALDEGRYHVDVYANGKFISTDSIFFKKSIKNGELAPCFDENFYSQKIGAKRKTESDSISCLEPYERLPGATFSYDQTSQRLELTIPQSELNIRPSGYVDPEDWAPGETMIFANYDASIYRSEFNGLSSTNSNYGYIGLSSGINFGLWRLRQQSSFNHSNFGNYSYNRWNSIRTYVQRALPSFRSELTLGDSFTEGQLFGSLGYRGLRISSDDRMLPASQRSYAPIIKGVARSNARVVISQNTKKIYETTVAPGPFIINDLYGTNYAGDLDVQVIETDGSINSFTVPFSSVPESMRPGLTRYSFSLGSARGRGTDNDIFSNITLQRGLTNQLTINAGAQVADDYLALLGGAVFATKYGAFGFNTTFSNARVENNERKQGWRTGVNYSRTFSSTDTTLTLAGYRYSTEGYRELSDVLGVRKYSHDEKVWDSASHKQRDHLSLLINQKLGDYGSLYFSGSASSYYGGKKHNRQIQFGYSNFYRNINYSISYTKQRTTQYSQLDYDPLRPENIQNNFSSHGRSNNVLAITLTFPLGSGSMAPSFHTTAAKSSGESSATQYQTGISGTLGKDRNFSYGINANHENNGVGSNWNGNVQQRSRFATFGAGYADGKNYQQVNASVRGALVAHRYGLTFGPYVGETFALVEAKGAQGAAIRGGQGAKFNSAGFALAPSLTPYRYNPISIDSKGINENAEMVETERKIAPYAGATVHVKFKTVFGKALLINTRMPEGSPIPLGADVFDKNGSNIGIVGQGGQIYIRTDVDKSTLKVKWGNSEDEQCVLAYDIKGKTQNYGILRFDAICMLHQSKN